MRSAFVLWMIVLAVGFMVPAASSGFEPLSEAELDRTVASGVQAPPSSNVVQARKGSAGETGAVSQKNRTAGETGDEDTTTRAQEKTSDASQEVTLIAYRQALPVVMSQMTSASPGPLGRNGSYSLLPLAAVPDQKPATRAHELELVPLQPLPNGIVFFGR